MDSLTRVASRKGSSVSLRRPKVTVKLSLHTLRPKSTTNPFNRWFVLINDHDTFHSLSTMQLAEPLQLPHFLLQGRVSVKVVQHAAVQGLERKRRLHHHFSSYYFFIRLLLYPAFTFMNTLTCSSSLRKSRHSAIHCDTRCRTLRFLSGGSRPSSLALRSLVQ